MQKLQVEARSHRDAVKGFSSFPRWCLYLRNCSQPSQATIPRNKQVWAHSW